MTNFVRKDLPYSKQIPKKMKKNHRTLSYRQTFITIKNNENI